MAAASRYCYYNLLQNEKDSSKLQLKENKVIIEIPEKIEPKIFKAEDDSIIPILLKFIYNNQSSLSITAELNFQNSFSVISFACCLGIDSLQEAVSKYLMENILSEENCSKIYYEASVVLYIIII